MASIYLLTLKGLALNIERLLVFQNLCQVSSLEAFFSFYISKSKLWKNIAWVEHLSMESYCLSTAVQWKKKEKNGAFQGTLEDFIVYTVSEFASY